MGLSAILMMKLGSEVRIEEAIDVQSGIAAIRVSRQPSVLVSLLVTFQIALG